MSIKVSSTVWERSGHGGAELLVLLAIADHADEHGIAYPSVLRLSRRCRMSERYVYDILKRLFTSGELQKLPRRRSSGSNVYRITLAHANEVPGPSSDLHFSSGVRPELHLNHGSPLNQSSPLNHSSPLNQSSSTPEPQFAVALNQSSDKPSENRQKPLVQRSTVRPRTALPEPFLPSEAVHTWVASKGLSHLLNEYVDHFVCYAKANGARYVDWQAALMNSIRGDWARLRKTNSSDADLHMQAQRHRRDRVEAIAPLVAVKDPLPRASHDVIDMEVPDALVRPLD